MSTPVDVHIGRRIRLRRRLLDLTQSDLASICDVRFQQIQKYESATNSLSASMLWRLATGLGVGVQYFYEGLGQTETSIPGDVAGLSPNCESLADPKGPSFEQEHRGAPSG
jgi:transcriptional regulator with XRE-family HTH domain